MATHIIDKARKYLDIIVNILQDELEITILEYSGNFDLLQFYESKCTIFNFDSFFFFQGLPNDTKLLI